MSKNKTRIPVYAAINDLNEGITRSHSRMLTNLAGRNTAKPVIDSEKLVEIILELAADAMIICDAGGNIIRANEKAHQLFNRNLVGQVLDRVFLRLYAGNCREGPEQVEGEKITFSAIRDNIITPVSEAVARVNNDKENRNLRLNFGQVNENGSAAAYLISLTDITEHKRLENELMKPLTTPASMPAPEKY